MWMKCCDEALRQHRGTHPPARGLGRAAGRTLSDVGDPCDRPECRVVWLLVVERRGKPADVCTFKSKHECYLEALDRGGLGLGTSWEYVDGERVAVHGRGQRRASYRIIRKEMP